MNESNAAAELLILDGSMGRELRLRGVEIPETIWSANALLTAPDVVVDVHLDNIRAGANVITTNSYGVIRRDLAKVGIEDRFVELNVLACELAAEARDRSGQSHVRIAGALPPLRGSFRADLVGDYDEILPLYEEQASVLAENVDVLLCETMSSAREAKAAATAACSTGKPVWVAWTLDDHKPGALRSGETIAAAWDAIHDLGVEAALVNCCPPERIGEAMPTLTGLGVRYCGGYGNTFMPIPRDWTLDGKGVNDGLLAIRDDLDESAYADFAMGWFDAGATIVGGCCGTSPAYIEAIARRLAP
ncbi:MAG: homocysteine S-methyltransferase family protein [Pseudomonadota bacterium]